MQVTQNYKIEHQKPQILYIIGPICSGKSTQCERLVRDFKFELLSIDELIQSEIESQSYEGLEIQKISSREAIPNALTIAILTKAIKSKKAKRFLVDGYLTTREQALEVEQQLREIEFVVNIDIPFDVSEERLIKRSPQADPEALRSIVSNYNDEYNKLTEMYTKNGRIYNVNGVGDIEEIYQQVRQAILPNLIFLYGAPSTGKSEVAQNICKHTGYRYMNLSDFYKVNKCQGDTDKINKLMKFFLETSDRNYVIDSFFEVKAQAVVFFEHFGKPRNVFYFQSSKDEIEQNIRQFTKSESDKKTKFTSLQTFLQNRDELLEFFRQFSFFQQISAVDSIVNITQKVFAFIKPQVYATICQNKDMADGYISFLERDDGFIRLRLQTLCAEESNRKSSLGNSLVNYIQSGQTVPAEIQSELIRKIIFQNPQNKRFILTNFPDTKEDFEVFETLLFPIDGLFNFMQSQKKMEYSKQLNPALHFIAQNKHLKIYEINLSIARAFLTKRTQFGLIVGPSTSGKTTLGQYICQKFGYTLVDWETTIPLLKEKLGQPEQPLEVLTLEQIVDYYKKLFANVTGEKFVFDGFPSGYDSGDQFQQFMDLGQPTWLLGTSIFKDTLWNRFKLKSQMEPALELSPEDDEKMDLMIQTGETAIAYLNQNMDRFPDCNLYLLDVNNSLEFTQSAIDYIYQKRIFLARSLLEDYLPDQLQNLKLVFINVAAQNNMSFVDVESLLQNQQSHTSQEFGMRQTSLPAEFPSNYTPTLVVKLIHSYLQSLQTNNRDVLLWGYPSADYQMNKQVEETLFPRVTDEIVCIEKQLGPIRLNLHQYYSNRMVYVLNDHNLNEIIDDPELILEKPVEKVKVIVDGDDPQDLPPDDPDDIVKPKMNIFDYKWTMSDGHPKNIAQIYTQLKQPIAELITVQPETYQIIFDSFNGFLRNINEDISANFFVQVQVSKE